MTRLRTAFLFLAMLATDYGTLMLTVGQLTDFAVSAGICAVGLLSAGLVELFLRLSSRTAIARELRPVRWCTEIG